MSRQLNCSKSLMSKQKYLDEITITSRSDFNQKLMDESFIS